MLFLDHLTDRSLITLVTRHKLIGELGLRRIFLAGIVGSNCSQCLDSLAVRSDVCGYVIFIGILMPSVLRIALSTALTRFVHQFGHHQRTPSNQDA